MPQAIPGTGTAEGGTSSRVALALGGTVGILAVVIGLLPHLLSGARPPHQELWYSEATVAQLPLAPMPLGYPYLIGVAAMIVAGGAIAGLALAALRLRRVAVSVRAAVLSGVAAQAVVLAATAILLSAELRNEPRATVYVLALTCGHVAMVAIASAACAWLASLAPARLILGGAISLIPAAHWWTALLNLDGVPARIRDPLDFLMDERLWAITLGLLIGTSALGSWRTLAAGFGALAALWVMPAAMLAVGYALVSSTFVRLPADARDAGWQMFAHALSDGDASTRLVACVLTALAAAAASWQLRASPRVAEAGA